MAFLWPSRKCKIKKCLEQILLYMFLVLFVYFFAYFLMCATLSLFSYFIHIECPVCEISTPQKSPYSEEARYDTSLETINNVRNRTNLNKTGDIIHIAIVCGGYNSTRNFYVLLKSILFHRTDVIHLHLLVDGISRGILHDLFRTWTVPDLIVSYYNATKYEHEVSWITSLHYSQRFGLMKLAFFSALQEERNLSKVIVMDTDMIVLGNIKHVWKMFDLFTEEPRSYLKNIIFGMVENQSRWYLGDGKLSRGRSVWPAAGRGYNSGLILANLTGMRMQNWTQIWRQVAESELTTHLSATLADQDIFNAVIKSHRHMIYNLPCSFNIQLNDHTEIDEGCLNREGVRIIHWNSPHKLESKNSRAEHFKKWFITFRNWDGKLLEENQYANQNVPEASEQPVDRLQQNLHFFCQEIVPKPWDKLRTYLYFLDYEKDAKENDVTLVVHLSLDRLQVLDELASHWTGPISAALYLYELETNLLLESVQNSKNLAGRKNIGYHLAFRDQGFNYPINKLRNIALNNALTPYVFLSDIDFLPSIGLYDYLRQAIAEMTVQKDINPLTKHALVIPAFENLQYKFNFPSGKIDLITQLNMGSISVFREQIWPQGHAATNYAKWKASTKPYHVEWEPEYEPFVVTSKDVPRFDERFVGFGWNKVEHIMQLAAAEYKFTVLPEAFVIHKFHSASFDIMKHRESIKYRACVRTTKRIFLNELSEDFPQFFQNISLVGQQSTIKPSIETV